MIAPSTTTSAKDTIFLPRSSMFVLSGEELTLPCAELRALLEAYAGRHTELKQFGKLVTCNLSDERLIDQITQRAAYCKFGGTLLSHGSSFEELVNAAADLDLLDADRTFAVRSRTVPRPFYGDLGGLLKQRLPRMKVSLENPDYVFQLESIGNEFFLGFSRSGDKEFSWRERRPRARGFFLPSAIYPKLARALVNLSRVKEGDVFIDPFCGTGSLVLESELMGIDSFGFDVKRWITRGAQRNLRKFCPNGCAIVCADSTFSNLPISNVDAVSTDVPYGRASSTSGKQPEKIIREFLETLAKSMRPEDSKRTRYCVLMHPSHVKLDLSEGLFQETEKHLIYVHRNLTREISVLRRLA